MKTIIFDLDNTILFLSNEWEKIYESFIKKYNLNVTAKDLFLTVGKIEKNNPDKYISKEFFVNHINENLSLNIDLNIGDALLDKYTRIPLSRVDEVRKLLEYLSSKYKIIAYTNWFTDNQIKRLKLNGLDKYFKKVYGWDILPVKPSRKGLEEIIKDDDMNKCIFIGDNLEGDIILPDSMGMDTIFYNYKNIPQDKYKEVKDIIDLKNIL